MFFIAYELDTWSRDLNSDFTLKYCLLRGVKLVKNADPALHYSIWNKSFLLDSLTLLKSTWAS